MAGHLGIRVVKAELVREAQAHFGVTVARSARLAAEAGMESGEDVSGDLVMPIRMFGHGVRGTRNKLMLHRQKEFAVEEVFRRDEKIADNLCGHAMEVRSVPANRNDSGGNLRSVDAGGVKFAHEERRGIKGAAQGGRNHGIVDSPHPSHRHLKS